MAIGELRALSACAGIFLVAASAAGLAQQPADETTAFDGEPIVVVVTATRTPRPAEEVPASVAVITRQELEESGVETADQALRKLAGVDVTRTSGLSSAIPRVALRGAGHFPEGRTLVLMDGIPQNDIYSGAVKWNQIPLEEIERIEVVRGPASALYGPSAMGGVINIITRRPERGKETTLRPGYGSLDTRFLSFSHRQGWDRFGCFLFANRLVSDGYIPVPADERNPYDIERNTDTSNLGARLAWQLDQASSLTLSATHSREWLGRGRRYYYHDRDIDRYSVSYRHEAGGRQWLGTVYLSDEGFVWPQDKRPDYDRIDYVERNPKRDWGANLQMSLAAAEGYTVTWGVDYRRGRAEKEDRYLDDTLKSAAAGRVETAGLFVQDEIQLSPRATAMVGLRYDRWENTKGHSYDEKLDPPESVFPERTDSALSPRGGLVYHASKDTSFRVSAGRGFRPPNLYELYTTQLFGLTLYRGNPRLDPETMTSYELGVDHWFPGGVLAKATLYQAIAEDYIYSVTVDPVARIKEKRNVGRVKIGGLELEAEGRLSEGWSWFTNYTYNRSRIDRFAEDPSLVGKELQYTPRHKGALGISYRDRNGFRGELAARYAARRYTNDANSESVASYWTLDLRSGHRIGDSTDLSVTVENLADRIYREYEDYEVPGRLITLRLEWSF